MAPAILTVMNSTASNPKWKEKVNITYEEYFNPPWYIPHIGIVQIARELERELGREKAYRIISRSVERLAYDWAKQMTRGISVDSLGDVERGLAPIHDLLDFKIGSGGGGCLWAKSFREMGAEDIGYLWACGADHAIMRALNPRIKLKQGKTRMHGCESCDNQVTWSEDESEQ